METTIQFRGFSYTVGSNMVAQLQVTRAGSWEAPSYLNIPIFLSPGEEPTEERILEIIRTEYARMQEYKQPFRAFEEKYRGREISLEQEPVARP